MKNLVLADFRAKPGKLAELEAALRAALPDTRAFDGCISLETFFEPSTDTFSIVEDWESFDHYDRYLAWRMETGLADLLDDLLDGGAAGFSPRKLDPTDI